MVAVSITTNAADLVTKLQRFRNKGLFVAHSKAEQRTVEKAQKKAKESMPKALHKPSRQSVNSVARSFRQAGKIKAGIGSSSVFIKDYAVDYLWYNTVTQSGNPRKLQRKNPEGGRSGIIIPSRRVRNPAGNLRAFRSRNPLQRFRDSKKYFEVSIGSKIRAKNGLYLTPGIYEIRKLRRGQKLRLVVRYEKDRYITPRWKFRQIVSDCYSDQFPVELNAALDEEIAKVFN